MNEPFRGTRQEIGGGMFLVTLEGAPSEQEFTGFLEEMGRWLANFQKRGAKVSLIVDPSALTRFDASMRQGYGEWRARNMDLIRASCHRAAYITESALWRGIMTAVFWVAKPAIPVQTFANRAAAQQWLESE